jgi:hypothetical protein
MRIRSASLVSALVAVALVAAACTSGDDTKGASESSSTTRAPAHESNLRTPTLSTPTAAGKGVQALATDMDLASVGYMRDEFFYEGEAVGYRNVGTFGPDGEWRVEETEAAPYKSRMVVIRPNDPADFNGTVYVEWFNVTGGVDAGATWISGHNEILRSGAAWVGVTAQAAGVNGGERTVQSSAVDIPQGGLAGSDPERYGTLHHPGDLYSYDIYTQAGVALRGDGKGVSPLQGFDVKRLLGMGESQSAGRLTTYVNAVQPVAGEYDGFLIYSRGSTAAPLGARPLGSADPTIPDVARIRTDLKVPVFTFETEYDVSVLGYADARQPDSKSFRLWEVAGTSHQDAYSAGGYALTDLGDGAAEAGMLDPAKADGGLLSCAKPLNAGAMHAVLAAALADLDTWVRDGTAPPRFGRIETTGQADAIQVVRDELGIAKGGIRTPIVDVPLAANVGDNSNSPNFCSVFGHTEPFDAATLARLYPNGSADYVRTFDKSVDRALEAGIWLKPEARNFKAAAQEISFS